MRETARRNARFTVVTGRRRVGKTALLKQALSDGRSSYLYWLVTRKTEKVQCAAFHQEAEKILGVRIPGRVALGTANATDSRTILDAAGAEKLCAKGDMLYKSDDGLIRTQGSLITKGELERIMAFVVKQWPSRGRSEDGSDGDSRAKGRRDRRPVVRRSPAHHAETQEISLAAREDTRRTDSLTESIADDDP